MPQARSLLKLVNGHNLTKHLVNSPTGLSRPMGVNVVQGLAPYQGLKGVADALRQALEAVAPLQQDCQPATCNVSGADLVSCDRLIRQAAGKLMALR